MRGGHLAVLFLGVALFGVGEALLPCGPDVVPFGPPLSRADDAPRANPGAKEPAAAVDEDSIPEQQREKIALVVETGNHTAFIFDLIFLPDQRELVSASHDGTVRWWNVDTGELLQVLHPRLG